jgi:hypothetical protein
MLCQVQKVPSSMIALTVKRHFDLNFITDAYNNHNFGQA